MTTKTHALEDFKYRTQKLLESKTLRSLCVSGEWGIGKTFAWNKILKELRNAPAEHEVKYYAYVSLFGLSTIEQVSAAIIQESENYSLQEYAVHEQVLNWLPAFADLAWRFAKGILRSVLNLPFVLRKRSPQYFWGLAKHDSVLNAFKAVGNELMPWMPEKALICFDDLERKNGSLSVDQLFGLISHLQENLGCKIVFIFNDEKLNENDASQFHQSYEKVFDTNFKFQPNFAECIDIAVPGNDLISNEVNVCANALEIKNIRVLKRITPLCVEVSTALEDDDCSILKRAVKIIVLMEWAKNICGEEFSRSVRMHILKSLQPSDFPKSIPSIKSPEKVGEWTKLVKGYGFDGKYDLDIDVVEGVESGSFRKDRLRESSSKLLKLREDDLKRARYKNAWAPYAGPFGDNEEVVVKSLTKGFEENFSALGIHDLDEVVRIFDPLDREELARQFIQKFKDRQIMNHLNWEGILSDVAPHRPLHKWIIESAKQEQRDSPSNTFDGILKRLLNSHLWEDGDTEFLAESGVDEFVRFMKENHGVKTHGLILGALANIDGEGTPLGIVQDKIKEALSEIAAESRIDRLRVKNFYKIELSPPNPDT